VRPSGNVLPQNGHPSGTGTLSRELIAAGVCCSAEICSPDGAGDNGNVALKPSAVGIPDTAAPDATPDATAPGAPGPEGAEPAKVGPETIVSREDVPVEDIPPDEPTAGEPAVDAAACAVPGFPAPAAELDPPCPA